MLLARYVMRLITIKPPNKGNKMRIIVETLATALRTEGANIGQDLR